MQSAIERERDEARKSLDEMSKHLAQATAQRDHAETELRKWMAFAKNVLGERDKAMQNLKLLDIAQWFANHFVDECYELPHEDHELHDRLSLCPVILKARELKTELDQLKESLE
jgi:chromosome segregation ATPase